MYINRIFLSDIRCFDKLTIDFEKVGLSTVIAGDNGAGKSAILRSIAMGLCDQNSAAALLRELPGEFVRNRQSEGTIEIDIKSRNGKKYRIRTLITSLKAFEKISQKLFELVGDKNKEKKLTDENFPWESVFVSGYGAGIRTQGSSDFQHYVPVDAVYPLFKYDVPLQNPELAVRRLVDEARKKGKKNTEKSQLLAEEMLTKIKDLVGPVLNLDKNDKFYLESTGIYVKGHWGKAELGALGDGYRSTITMLLDLIAWWMLYSRVKDPTKLKGIVIIDELEQHLHPQWQLKIMELLKSSWPSIQFIISTHSPLVISGSKGIPVWSIEKGAANKHDVFGWIAEDVYRRIMKLDSSRAKELEEKLSQFRRLHFKKLDESIKKEELSELRHLEKEFSALPPSDPSKLISKLKNIKKSAMQKKIN